MSIHLLCIHKRTSCVYTRDLLCMHNTLVHALGQGPQGLGARDPKNALGRSQALKCVNVTSVAMLRSYAKLYETMPNYAKLCETMRNYAKLCETIRNYCIFTFVFSLWCVYDCILLLYSYYCLFTAPQAKTNRQFNRQLNAKK